MKRIIVLLVVLAMGLSMQAQEMKVIKLNAPNKTKGEAVMKVFNQRQSVREYAAKELSQQDLSDLLWAANGVNRADGRRTAPSARNVQDVDIYVVMKEGAYLYDAKAHQLNPVAPGDHRAAIAASQDYVKTAPVCLVLVSDLSRMGNPQAEQTKLMAAVDVGIVCQNINIACAGLGLATVPRGIMNHAELAKALQLKDTQLLLMNNPVGYPK
ncbi:SagB-type dehydrogenase family enzyme [Parabacteroides sp. PFB2-10]|uniref:nitroreductase family protein n=1 Tax=Parabacteroides sp. PFB2-10 TaxID=1742405 RepID=UPI0024757F42|nr:SagB/ThcOx family dehydrogenase [Parabacteroides sp. PFB2-10]MDH6313947.1 SagB-type dehydrogenase family enzyme [Parabacteroides sp. PFB2-10]